MNKMKRSIKKFRDLLNGTPLSKRFNILIDDAKSNLLRDLGKNDYIHSKNVEKNLDRMLPDSIKENEDLFDKAEIFLLLYATYLHDIGRKNGYNDLHELYSFQLIKKNHLRYKLNEYEADAVAEICYGHAKESEKSINSIDRSYGIEYEIPRVGRRPLNLQFMAALLRLADECDNAFTRVQGVGGEEESIRKLIRYIDFDSERWIIEFQCSLKGWKDWTVLEQVRQYTQSRLDEIRHILEPRGLLYNRVWLNKEDFIWIQIPKPAAVELGDLINFIRSLYDDEI